MTFHLPDFAGQYCRVVETRCRHLIKHGVWGGIEQTRLDSWLNNFESDLERYFAAHLLDALLYRSEPQTIALAKHLFQRSIPDASRKHSLAVDLQTDLLTGLRSNGSSRMRIIPVRPSHSSGKSGDLVVRYLRRKLRFDSALFIDPGGIQNAVNGGASILIFVDDFLGTGDQFEHFFHEHQLKSVQSSISMIYATLAAHETGISTVFQTTGIRVATAELLTPDVALFDSNQSQFRDDENSNEDARAFYFDLLERRGIEVAGPERRGYGHLGLAYAFQHAAPDNSLLTYWWNKSSDWQPLLDR